MKTRVIGLGAGGHARVMIDALRADDSCEIVGLLDPDSRIHDSKVESVPVLGGDEKIESLVRDGITHFFLGMGGAGDMSARASLHDMAKRKGLLPYPVLHPSAIVANSSVLGPGSSVLAGVIVNPGVRTGEGIILNSGCIIEHDVEIGDHVHVAPGACLLGGVRVGAFSFVGARSVVRQGVKVGNRAVIGMGAVILDEVENGATVVGNPGCRLR